MRVRLIRILLTGLAVAALAAAGIAANFFLLGYSDPQVDPVGRLTPRSLTTQPAPLQRGADDMPGTETKKSDD